MPRPSAMPPAAITGTRDGVDDLRHQRERADLRLDAVVEEHAAVAAGLGALGDDRVAAVPVEPDRLVDGGRRGDDLRAGGAHPVEERRLGSPKWKLTTSGRNSSTRAQKASSKGARWPAGVGISGSRPSSR